jgi:triosephosphate isomerase (TIM)
MKRPILVANWKNHPASLSEARRLLSGLSRQTKVFKKITTFVAPPTTYLELAATKVRSYAGLAVQDIFFTSEGTYTGAISPDILKSFGVKLAIVGHSERRKLGENNELVAAKIKTALRAGITPLLCVGEPERDPEGSYFEFISDELRSSLDGVKREEAGKLIVAYEPIWAIGKKARDAMAPEDLAQMTIFIKKVLTQIFNRKIADRIPILYGGSVEPANASALIETGVNGFLVGHASLDDKSFTEIAKSL